MDRPVVICIWCGRMTQLRALVAQVRAARDREREKALESDRESAQVA